MDDKSIEHAAYFQTEKHKTFIKSRWMPARVDEINYGKFGRATVTATLFGGMSESTFIPTSERESGGQINGAENTLKHTAGHYGPGHMASGGKILRVKKTSGKIPLGSSGIQVQFETDLVIEGIRPGTGHPRSTGLVGPRCRYPGKNTFSHNTPEDRFPTPAIFPKY